MFGTLHISFRLIVIETIAGLDEVQAKDPDDDLKMEEKDEGILDP